MKEQLNMKMKYSLSLIGLLLCSMAAMCQQLDRQVIASAGGNGTNSFTIGEVVVSSNNLEVTAGFQQPLFIEKTITGIRDVTSELKVFPVPAKDVVSIVGAEFQGMTTEANLYTLTGIQVKFGIERSSKEMRLNLGHLPVGNYFLTLLNETNQTVAKYKILKIK